MLVRRTAIPERKRPALLMTENGDDSEGVGSRYASLSTWIHRQSIV